MHHFYLLLSCCCKGGQVLGFSLSTPRYNWRKQYTSRRCYQMPIQ
jgi:hypothetical protein